MSSLPTFSVQIEAHEIPPRWRLEAQSIQLAAATDADARLRVIRWCHGDAGTPPWKPCARASWPHTSTKRLSPADDGVAAIQKRSRQ